MKKFDERSHTGQMVFICAAIMAILLPIFGALIWAGDKALDEKYATDKEIISIQETMGRQVKSLTAVVVIPPVMPASSPAGASTIKAGAK